MPPRKTKATTATRPAGPLRAALYLRVSTEDQVDMFGLPVQLERGRAMVAVKGWSLDESRHIFRDEAISGTKDETGRPQLAALLAAVDAGEIDAVIIKALDRLGRDMRIILDLVDQIKSAGCELVSCDEALDTSTPAGRFVVHIFAALAELDHQSIVKRLKDGRNARYARDGERGGPLPFGYIRTDDGIAIDDHAARAVRTIFAQRAEGAKLRAIAASLNEQWPSPRGARWHASSVRVVLENEQTYRGQRGTAPWPAIL